MLYRMLRLGFTDGCNRSFLVGYVSVLTCRGGGRGVVPFPKGARGVELLFEDNFYARSTVHVAFLSFSEQR